MPVAPKSPRGLDADIAALSPSRPVRLDDSGDLRLKPNWPLLYRVCSHEFELVTLDGEAVLIPKLGADVIEPGVNNVKAYKPDSTAEILSAAEAPMRRNMGTGWRYLSPDETIPADFLPDGVSAGGFLRRRRTVTTSGAEGWFWHDCWTTFEMGVDGLIPVAHRDLMYRYLRAANAVGIANPGSVFDIKPSPQALQRVRGPFDQAMRAWERATNVHAEIRDERLAEAREAIKAVDAAASSVGKRKSKTKTEPEVVA